MYTPLKIEMVSIVHVFANYGFSIVCIDVYAICPSSSKRYFYRGCEGCPDSPVVYGIALTAFSFRPLECGNLVRDKVY